MLFAVCLIVFFMSLNGNYNEEVSLNIDANFTKKNKRACLRDNTKREAVGGNEFSRESNDLCLQHTKSSTRTSDSSVFQKLWQYH